jgi:hypothetical protein
MNSDKLHAESIREQYAKAWTTLKTLLFSLVMVGQSIIEALMYCRSSFKPSFPSPTIASQLLDALLNLSFVSHQIGGITATSKFIELHKFFYRTVDCISTSEKHCTAFFMKHLELLQGNVMRPRRVTVLMRPLRSSPELQRIVIVRRRKGVIFVGLPRADDPNAQRRLRGSPSTPSPSSVCSTLALIRINNLTQYPAILL